MSTYAPDRRNRMLTFAQLTYNTVAGSEDGTPIAEQLKAARRVARVVNRETAPLKMAWDFSDLSLTRRSRISAARGNSHPSDTGQSGFLAASGIGESPGAFRNCRRGNQQKSRLSGRIGFKGRTKRLGSERS